MKAIQLDEYGSEPQLKEVPIPQLHEGQLLIKVQGSTVNPSDRLFIQGNYRRRPLPTYCGIEGTGTVVKSHDQKLSSWVGKRVCFVATRGSWCDYAVSSPITVLEITKDVSLSSAASGIINPLTVIGFIENFKRLGGKGIIHTAAASSLGRMLNKLCLKQGIPLLNLVRKEEQAEALKKDGAKNVIITTGNWQQKLQQFIVKEGFNVIYDALGGGPVTASLIAHLPPQGTYHVYGALQGKPLEIKNPASLFQGSIVTGFSLFPWWPTASKETQERVRASYSDLLKNELATSTYKELHIKDIKEAIELSVSKANEGKILLKFD